MTTMRPRTPCTIARTSNQGYDGNGRPKVSTTRTKTRCAVIHVTSLDEKSSVRADTSASRGRFDQLLYDYHLLFHPRDELRMNDLVIFDWGNETVTIKVQFIERRIDVDGRLHHIEIKGDRWASE